MLGLATTAPGLEGVTERELSRAGADPVEAPLDHRGVVAYEVDDPAIFVDLLETARTVHRAGPVLARGRVDPTDPWTDLARLVDQTPVEGWFSTGPFAVRGHRRGEHPFTSMDVAAHVGDRLHDHLKTELGTRPEVDLDSPHAMVRVHVDDPGRVCLWLDLAGPASLHRRGHRVYSHRAAMKPSLACGLLELMNWEGQGPLADPMAGGGTVLVEAAWKACGLSPIALRDDLLAQHVPCLPRLEVPDLDVDECPRLLWGDHASNHLDGARANVERAGLNGRVEFYVDRARALPEHVTEAAAIATNPPYGIRSSEEDQLAKSYRELLQAAEAALAEEGRLGVMTPLVDRVEAAAEPTRLEVTDRREVLHGGLTIALLVLS
jgi:23S rRNA G2445 N2-methylase RlmL